MTRGRYREAAATAAREGDELLRHLDRGLALFYAGDVLNSNLCLARAEDLAEERYTRSVSAAALSLLVNDTVLPYQPDPWERLLVPLYRALNYVSAGEPLDVTVEARRLASMLLERRDREPERAAREGDAFLAYLAGVLFEWAGRMEEATVAYRNAAGAYGPASFRTDRAGAGELALLVEGGFVAPPVEEKVFLVLDEGDVERGRRDPAGVGRELAKRALARRRGAWSDDDPELAYLLPVALRSRPVYALRVPQVVAEVAGRTFEVPRTLDLSAMAALHEETELPAVLAKAAVRALTKLALFEETTDGEGVFARVVADAIHLATEQADTRAWVTLPAELRFIRTALPPGTHDVRLRILGSGPPRILDLAPVRISSGHLTVAAARYY